MTLTVAAAVYFMGETQDKMAVHPETQCPVSTGPVAMTSILLDLTDPLTSVQSNKLTTYIKNEINTAEIGTQFTMGIVSSEQVDWGASPALCKPRSGTDVSVLTQNKGFVERRYVERFEKPLADTMHDMTLTTESDTSPIIEALEGLLADTPGFLTFTGPRRVIIVSDMLQNSKAMSFYKGHDWQSFRASSAFQLVTSSLQDADVQIYQIPRPIAQVKDPKVIEDFWVRFFDMQGANLPRLKKM